MPTPFSPSHLLAVLVASLLLAAVTTFFTRLDAAVRRAHVLYRTRQRRRRWRDGE